MTMVLGPTVKKATQKKTEKKTESKTESKTEKVVAPQQASDTVEISTEKETEVAQ
jgi:hypothetical protein